MKTYASLVWTIPFFLLACAESPSNPEPETSSATPISSETANSSGEHLSTTNSSSSDEEYSSGTEVSSSSTIQVSTNFDWQKCVSAGNCGTFKDSRDSRTYKWVTIGEQVWMGENLAGTYTWADAMGFPLDCNQSQCLGAIEDQHQGACPKGWHIPSSSEFQSLIQLLSSDPNISLQSHLQATSWGNGLDSYGFSAVPTKGDSSFFWGTREYGLGQANGLVLTTDFGGIRPFGEFKGEKHDVRCLKDVASSSSAATSSSSIKVACTNLKSDQFCDARDGKAYTFKKYGVQYWMTQNLNWEASGYCAFSPAEECSKRGRHYSPTEEDINTGSKSFQQGPCPEGWRVPSFEDWKSLATFTKGAENLKGVDDAAHSEWNTSFNNQDSAGFHLLPAGKVTSFGFSNRMQDSLTSAYLLTTNPGKSGYVITFLVDTQAGNQGTETWFGIESSIWENDGASVRCMKVDWSAAP